MTHTNTSMRTRLAELLLEKSYLEGSFVLTSGQQSDYYFDCKQTALHPEGGWLIGNLCLDIIARHGGIQGVGGMTLGADPLVSAVSVLSQVRNMPLPGFIVRKTSKGHGTNQYLEGLKNFSPGDQVCMLEDVVTTGGSLITACKRVEDAGLKVAQVICVLDREQGGADALALEGYTLEALFTRASLLQEGHFA
ncbi:orotate phosphoribosyltransferase [Desulfoplanes formicivorans]|uniref:Orotate phosphoribosyltransferase n=1 Tax=Desulfoplanes formicivorans TaxID=1592317 RepID=A0A194AGU5_9BACT|nr:orotate phosphoribosyltransferase [Desulfoplanes formicivorans]GAU08548.1 orotate phosphoribosyltransferase [Desulfoplanes formicivorans]